MDTHQVLSQHWLFYGVDPTSLERLLACSEQLDASMGETIYTPHCFRRCLGVLLSGRIRVSKETLVVSTLSEGDLFGAAALFTDSEEYATTLTALSDCSLVLIPQESVARLLQESSVFAQRYVRYLSERIQFLSRRLDAVSSDTAAGKLVQYLLSNTEEDGQLFLSVSQLSKRIGVSRATLYRAFARLERDSIIQRQGKSIRILRKEKLKQ